MRAGTRLGFYLLIMPLILWLALLIVIPHIDMFLVSIRERVGVRQYETSLANYLHFWIAFQQGAKPSSDDILVIHQQ